MGEEERRVEEKGKAKALIYTDLVATFEKADPEGGGGGGAGREEGGHNGADGEGWGGCGGGGHSAEDAAGCW